MHAPAGRPGGDPRRRRHGSVGELEKTQIKRGRRKRKQRYLGSGFLLRLRAVDCDLRPVLRISTRALAQPTRLNLTYLAQSLDQWQNHALIVMSDHLHKIALLQRVFQYETGY